MVKPQHGYDIVTLWSFISVYSDYQWRRRGTLVAGRRAMIGPVIQTMRTPRYKARPLICFITLQLLLCQVARALQLAFCHLKNEVLRCVGTSHARVHGVLGHVQLLIFFSCGVLCPLSSGRVRGMVNT